MTWALAGKILTVWIIIAVLVGPPIGRLLAKRRFQALVNNAKQPARKAEQALVNRELLISTIVEEQKDNAWMERARKAEGLGFTDPPTDPWAA